MYSLYGHPRYFKFKPKYRQYGLFFRTIFPFLMTGTHCNFQTKSAQVFNFGSRSAISNIVFRINEFDLLWVPHFIALAIYFIFGTKFTWNEGIDTCFNVEGVLLGLNFDFFCGYSVITACYLVITARYLMATGSYCTLLVVTARYRSLLLVPAFIMNGVVAQFGVIF